MTTRIWILGAADPEMEAIEALLRECGESVSYAADADGRRVRPGDAYTAARIVDAAGVDTLPCDDHVPGLVILPIECAGPGLYEREVIWGDELRPALDHHGPGHPGYGRPPSEFLAASSLGQVISHLARLRALPGTWGRSSARSALPGGIIRVVRSWCVCESDSATHMGCDRIIPRDLVLTAAADHCLGAAYRGECPGVDPEELMRWRAESRAAFQRRSVVEVLADIEHAVVRLRDAPELTLYAPHPTPLVGECESGHRLCSGCGDCVCQCIRVRDMRGVYVPELPEASTRHGYAYVADGLPDNSGRVKVVCSGTAYVIDAFLRSWGPSQGLVDIYGDPQRGFAGGYRVDAG